jgi:ribosomal protein S18 acetylase RimI-like enzyme
MLKFKRNKASYASIFKHLSSCNKNFIPALSARVNITDYATKILQHSITFEAWSSDTLIGLVAVYLNQLPIGFISSVSLLSSYQKQGVAQKLLEQCKEYAVTNGFSELQLEVEVNNIKAIKLYTKNGFIKKDYHENILRMKATLPIRYHMNNKRNYDIELKNTSDHQYAYSFDFDVMHHYMLDSFKPYFTHGNILELGSFKGDFTQRFLNLFEDITCVEASSDAIGIAKKKLRDDVTFIHSLFEKVQLPKKYNNIVMTHVLEHIDNPVSVLKRINDEWLTDDGKFFLVCPNANAPSRQIAVHMGLISHNSAVTQAEHEHGHRCTYTLDTLERDAKAAGLKVIKREGIFFKALANFQWDKLLKTDIISPEYLEGCYQLGQKYPELCSSIFLLCEKG